MTPFINRAIVAASCIPASDRVPVRMRNAHTPTFSLPSAPYVEMDGAHMTHACNVH